MQRVIAGSAHGSAEPRCRIRFALPQVLLTRNQARRSGPRQISMQSRTGSADAITKMCVCLTLLLKFFCWTDTPQIVLQGCFHKSKIER